MLKIKIDNLVMLVVTMVKTYIIKQTMGKRT